MAGRNLLPPAWLPLRALLQVVEELQEHDPREHRQPVEIAIEPLVLAHDVAARLHDRGKPLGGSQRLGIFGFSTSGHHILRE